MIQKFSLVVQQSLLVATILYSPSLLGQDSLAETTFCNPLNLDYGFCPIHNFVKQGKHRATADPVIVRFHDDLYLFSTNQWGYWWSHDFLHWTFVPRKFLKERNNVYDELCAPAAFVYRDELYVIGSTYEKNFVLWKSADPKSGVWTEAVEEFDAGAWDPAFFVDDDERIYLYHGSSNLYPLYGRTVDPNSWKSTEPQPMLKLQPELHGWERFGEANDNTFLAPFLEGAWMTKHDGKYYLQYGAPGTEFSGYADGTYVGSAPLGPFEYQVHNPFCYKPSGFARGSGHGATFQDKFENWWHTSTITIAVKNNFERRIGIWPTGFDRDGVLYCDTAFGDYPMRVPSAKAGEPHSAFAGWMLLNFAKPVKVSSTFGGHHPNFAVDEDIRTYWSAKTSEPTEWIETDLGETSSIHAIQINYADQDADVMGKLQGLFHQYRMLSSEEGTTWKIIVDKSQNRTDIPHEYVEFAQPVRARYIRLENVHMPTGKFAISGLRVFGKGSGVAPQPVTNFVVLRGDTDRRNAWLKWKENDAATGYLIRCGATRDKLYTSIMVYADVEYYFRAMTRDQPYFFQIQAFNENGLSAPSEIVEAK